MANNKLKLTNLYALGDYAFRVSSKLSKVGLQTINFDNNNNLRYIGDYAFEGSKISNVIDLSKCTFLKKINQYAFKDTLIKEIKLNDNLEFIDVGAFSESMIESIDLSNTKVNIISEKLFWQCNKLTNVNLNNSITEFRSKAFQGCSSLINLVLPTNLSSIGEYCFAADINYLGDVLIPSAGIEYFDFANTKINKIAARTFEGCTKLKKIKLGSTFETIDDYIFNKCSGLVEVDFSESKITKISKGLFADCINLSTVLLPNEIIDTIDSNAFLRCKNLKTLGTKIDLNYYSKQIQNKVIIPNTVNTISNNAFQDSGILDVDLSLTALTELPYNLFLNCLKLNNVKLPTQLTNIKNSTFNNCNSLENVNFTDLINLELIGSGNFNNFKIGIVDLSKCKKLRSIGVANSNDPSSFSNMPNLQKVMMPTTYPIQISNQLFTMANSSGAQIPISNIGYYNENGSLSVPDNVINSSQTSTNLMYDRMSDVDLSEMKNLINIVPNTFTNNNNLTNVIFPSRALNWQIENGKYNTACFSNNNQLEKITFTNFRINGTGQLIEPGSGWNQINNSTYTNEIKNQLTNILNIFASDSNIVDTTNLQTWSFNNQGTTSIWNKDWYTDENFTNNVTGNGSGALGDKVNIAYKKNNEVIWKYTYNNSTGEIKLTSNNVNLYRSKDSKNTSNLFKTPFATQNGTNKQITIEIQVVPPKTSN